MSVRVELDWLQMFDACLLGVARRMSSMAKDLDANKHAEISDFNTDIWGAVAEACFSQMQDCAWPRGIGTFKQPDVAEWQVRSTSHPGGHLIIRPNDVINYRVAFAITTMDYYGAEFIGWIETDYAKQKQNGYWRADKNSWWVPQSDLIPFDSEAFETKKAPTSART